MTRTKEFSDLSEEEQENLSTRILELVKDLGYPAHIVVAPLFGLVVSIAVGLGITKEDFMSSCSIIYDDTKKSIENLVRLNAENGINDTK